jgi:hypothetical protein
MDGPANVGLQPARKRLTSTDRSQELLPWQRALELEHCFLYWLPVNSFPAPIGQRKWLLQFFGRWSALLTTKMGLREELFFQFKAVEAVKNAFYSHQREFFPVLGLSRRPGDTLPDPPSAEEIRSMSKATLDTGKPADVNPYMPDYCFWFAKKAASQQREFFLGYGALTNVFLKPDPKAAPPQLAPQFAFLKKREDLKQFDLDGALATAGAMKDGFLPKSKELFGAGLEQEPRYEGLLFILPLLTSADFFSQPVTEIDKLFQLTDVYINESPADGGVLLAFREEWEEELIEVLQKMRDEGLDFPER